jgi:hypothetical protein
MLYQNKMKNMKAVIIVLLLVIFAVSGSAQSKRQFTPEQLNLALKKAKIIKRTGAVITISGCVLDITGIVLLATSPVNGHRYSYFLGEEVDTYDWRGGYVLLTGVVLSLGGITRVATILNELVEEMDSKEFDPIFFSSTPSTAIQRLGYLIEKVINNETLLQKSFKYFSHKFLL